jgi:ferritin
MDIAAAEQDHATKIFLQWFVSEQVEEEAAVGGILSKLRLIRSDSSCLFLLDAELGKRVFVPPTQKAV